MRTPGRKPTSRLSFHQYDDAVFREMLDRNGYVYMDDVPEGFGHVEFFEAFGELLPQYAGEQIWSVKAEARFEDMYHSLNTRPLMPHTECYEFPGAAPRYLGLWCLVPAEDGGGQTTLADFRPFLDELTPDEFRLLTQKQYEFISADGVRSMDLGRTAVHPMYEERADAPPILRFSYNCVEHQDDPFLLDIRERMVKFFEQNHVAVDIQRNALLLWNNHRMLHARTGYTDARRHLRRVWIADPA
ncbi:TauD/TfdA family dioxygenase [Streptomyces fuscichromogenes]|uniref:TauD/TfdA family dioxygenase n=1 Tax=Streptomyces fuscichromogenes TaxID=1324013 RepID=UPI00380FB773